MATTNASIDWYDANAAGFAARTLGPGMEGDQVRFLEHVPSGGSVLDAGCGAGRDALAFKAAGYAVTAFDGSVELARIASANTGLAVRHMTFAGMDWDAAFDGIWACASLLHLPRADLPSALGAMTRALKPGGVFYASFKEGTGERLADGRHFTDLTQPMLRELLTGADLQALDVWRAADARRGQEGNHWVVGIGRRAWAIQGACN